MERSKIIRKFKTSGLSLKSEATDLVENTLSALGLGDQEQAQLLERVLHNISEMPLSGSVIDENVVREAIEKLQKDGTNDGSLSEDVIFEFVDAFKFPRFSYSIARKQFLPSEKEGVLFASPEAKAEMFFERYSRIQQRVLRQPQFSGSLIGRSEHVFNITPINALIGNNIKEIANIYLLGMLSQIQEGRYALEDSTGRVPIDLSSVAYEMGVFTDAVVILTEGIYRDGLFVASSLIGPPIESRSATCAQFSNLVFPFTSLSYLSMKEKLENFELANEGFFVVISDVWFDHPQTISKLNTLLEAYAELSPPLMVVLIGHFSSQPSSHTAPAQIRQGLESLADVVSSLPSLASTKFVFVPGAKDPGGADVLPRPPLPPHLAEVFTKKCPNAVFATNPCRLRYCTQEIVFFREDLMSKMRRNAILPPKEEMLVPVGGEETQGGMRGEEEKDEEQSMHDTQMQPRVVSMAENLVKTVLEQATLVPLPLHIRPVYWDHAQALGLYPLPDMLVLADKDEAYSPFPDLGEGCLVFNPGPFVTGDFSFMVYYPTRLRSPEAMGEAVENSRVP